MLARVRSGALIGIDAVVVEVEVDMALGLPYFNVVGLPEGAVRESKVRVVSALKNSDFDLPQKRITVNLAPADIRKEGAAFELPIALGVLAAARLIPEAPLAEYLFGGELSLDGKIKPIRGVLPLAIAARDAGFKGVLVPAENAGEASLVDKILVLPVRHLREAVEHVTGVCAITPYDREKTPAPVSSKSHELDLADVRGQDGVKVAIELAAAGGHNLLMCGPPGSGKTMLARRLPALLPPMTFQEALEVTKIYSVLGLLGDGRHLLNERPFRAPHHTISDAGLVGGGPLTRPGELSMAHHGVLFLDELPEFRKNVLEVLRQPLEEGLIHLARASQNVTYPCRVMLVAAMNPCPCGFYNVKGRGCRCMPNRVQEYHNRVSAPLLDRVDINIETSAVDYRQLTLQSHPSLTTARVRARADESRERQRLRFREHPGVFCNAQMPPQLVRRFCRPQWKAEAALRTAMNDYGLSARAHDRILKVARTSADLEGHADIEEADMEIAIACRVLDRQNWLIRYVPKTGAQKIQAYFEAEGDRLEAASGSAADASG